MKLRPTMTPARANSVVVRASPQPPGGRASRASAPPSSTPAMTASGIAAPVKGSPGIVVTPRGIPTSKWIKDAVAKVAASSSISTPIGLELTESSA